MTAAPPAATLSTCSARRAKSAERIEGASSINLGSLKPGILLILSLYECRVPGQNPRCPTRGRAASPVQRDQGPEGFSPGTRYSVIETQSMLPSSNPDAADRLQPDLCPVLGHQRLHRRLRLQTLRRLPHHAVRAFEWHYTDVDLGADDALPRPRPHQPALGLARRDHGRYRTRHLLPHPSRRKDGTHRARSRSYRGCHPHRLWHDDRRHPRQTAHRRLPTRRRRYLADLPTRGAAADSVQRPTTNGR